jgi:hypothetical protein
MQSKHGATIAAILLLFSVGFVFVPGAGVPWMPALLSALACIGAVGTAMRGHDKAFCVLLGAASAAWVFVLLFWR